VCYNLLMVRQVRARSEDAKAARRGEILAQTRQLWTTTRYEALTLQQVAEGVGLSKPALYAYFPTKEELFLSLTQEALGGWLAALEQHLRLGGRHTPQSLVNLMVTLVQEHPELFGLMPLLSGLFERNLSAGRAAEYKHWLADWVQRLGPLLERALPGLPAGGGLRLLIYTQALIAGLYPMSDPSVTVQQVLSDPALEHLRVDFLPALQDALTALCVGLLA
jgi:TetR/AcrR family transcriptional regulator